MQASSQIALTHSYYEALFNSAAIGILVTDSEGKISAINPFALNMFGYTEDELLMKNINFLIPARFHTIHNKHHEVYFNHPQTRPMGVVKDIYAVTKNGKEFCVQVSLASFTHAEQKFTIAYISDNTDSKKREEQLHQNGQQIKLLIEHSPAAIAMFDREMRYIIVSRRWMQDYRLGDRDITGLSHYEVFPEIPEKWRSIHQRCLTGEQFSCEEESFTRIDGKTDWIKWEICPWYSETKSIGGAILFTEVLTRQKEYQTALQQININLEETIISKTKKLSESLEKEKSMNELKSRFVSIASHEFRTPLSTILSSAYLIEKYVGTEDQPKREKHLQRISSAVSLLTDTLNDFLSIGKIEEGKIHVKPSGFSITGAIRTTLREIKPTLKAGQSLHYTHQGEDDVFLDQGMLKHVVMNLISNASKFSAESSVIEVATRNKETELLLSVKDTGIGIPENEKEHLMERFYRCSNATNIEGTGLGLHIVLKYVELMNGKVEYESELDKGTLFRVILNKEK